jgi:hypothetical protein
MGWRNSAPYGASERATGDEVSARGASERVVGDDVSPSAGCRLGRLVVACARERSQPKQRKQLCCTVGRCVCAREKHWRGYRGSRLRPNRAGHSQPMATPWDTIFVKPKALARAPQNDVTPSEWNWQVGVPLQGFLGMPRVGIARGIFGMEPKGGSSFIGLRGAVPSSIKKPATARAARLPEAYHPK